MTRKAKDSDNEPLPDIRVISPKKAAEILDVSERTVLRMAKDGELAWCRVRRQTRIRYDSVIHWIEENTIEGPMRPPNSTGGEFKSSAARRLEERLKVRPGKTPNPRNQ